MLKACSRCGRIHERGYVCIQPGKRNNMRCSQADRFRNTQVWKRKTKQIRNRDINMCRVCREKKYNTKLMYNCYDLSVHHIIPLAEDFEKRLDDGNLITLCSYHHELAERGAIPRSELLKLAGEPVTL